MDKLITIPTAINVLKILIATSIFFVWVVKYQNIVKEFKEFQLPNWLRDLVGILKLSFSIMVISNNDKITLIGSLGIAILMIAALITHVRVKNPLYKMIPAIALLAISSFIFLISYDSNLLDFG